MSAYLLKDRSLIISNFVTFVVAYTPTEEAPEGQKTINMAALNSTVVSVPARKYVFLLTYETARTEKRSEGSGDAGCKVLGAYDRDVLNENDKPILGFVEDDKLVLSSEHLYFHP